MKKGLFELVVIADRSGSMFGMIDEARNSINRFIDEQKKIEGEALFTFVMFDDEYEVVVDGKNIKKVKNIGEEYKARGCTALLDAIGYTFDNIGKKLADTKEKDRPEKVIVAIVTDGHENASKKYSRDMISGMIKKQQDEYSWEILFFAANMDAVDVGTGINIMASNCCNYAANSTGVKTAYGIFTTTVTTARNKSNEVA